MKRFNYNRSIGMVYDDLTGRYVIGDEDTAILLNSVSDRADRNAELYWDLYYALECVMIHTPARK